MQNKAKRYIDALRATHELAALLRLEPVSVALDSYGLKYTYFKSDYR